jgi:Tol biopolymer transport system component
MEDIALSRDGTRVGVSAFEDGNADIWIHDVERGTQTRLTNHPAFDFEPTFSPSGEEVAFVSPRNGNTDLFVKAADGSGQIRSLAMGDASGKGVPHWSPDGKYIAYFVNGSGRTFDLGYLSLADNAEPAFLFKTPFHENEPAISPDGRYIAYTSNESGRYEVYVSPFPEGDGRWVVSVNGGMHPKWNGQGDELFYKEVDALMVVTVDTRLEFKAGTPQKLFDNDEVDIRLYDTYGPLSGVYDVTADGQRFVMFESLEEETNLVVVLNWFEELKRLVPTDN